MIVVKEGSKNDGGPGSHRRTGAAGAVAMAVDHATDFFFFGGGIYKIYLKIYLNLSVEPMD